MIVKVIRGNDEFKPDEPDRTSTLVCEPKTMEFRKLPPNEQASSGAADRLMMFFHDESGEELLLFPGDEVWLTNETGATADRWKI